MPRSYAAILLLLASAAPAHAEEPVDGGGEVAQEEHAPYRVNLRVGSSSSDRNGMPTVCAEVRVWADLAVESCGTGADLWHNSDGPEMMHVRALWEIYDRTTRRGRGGVRVGGGFAELAVGDDKLGFEFGDPDSRDPVSVAGPEVAVSAQWTIPLGKKLEAVGTFTGGVGYFAGARKLILPRDEVQPFASIDIGVGW
ncbi:MAG: hypothetical protein K8M05_14630 [Deltaproteobacteria bacterium]|nr:hypothetical protein [Kofleriaceae bacterium]